MNDKVEEEDLDLELVEEQVLTRWEKIMKWAGMIKTFFTVGKIIWGLIFVTGGAVVVGQATDTKPIREAAVAIGILDERPSPGTQEVSRDALWDEVMNLQGEVDELEASMKAMEAQVQNHTHKVTHAAHSHDLQEHTHAPPDMTHEHPAVVPVLIKHDHPVTEHTHPEFERIRAGKEEIDNAFLRHVKDDH